MKRGLFLVSLLLVSTPGACGPVGGGLAVAGPETAEKSAPSGLENVDLAVGDTAITTEDRNTLTVFSYELPLSPAGASEPKPGFEFSAIEVEGCASPSSGRDLMHVGSTAFVLRMPDGARVMLATDAEETEVKEPVLETMDPVPGQCDRGFVVFQTPRGERPESVIFEEQLTSEAMPIEWAIPGE